MSFKLARIISRLKIMNDFFYPILKSIQFNWILNVPFGNSFNLILNIKLIFLGEYASQYFSLNDWNPIASNSILLFFNFNFTVFFNLPIILLSTTSIFSHIKIESL